MNRFLMCLFFTFICSTSIYARAQTWREDQARLCFVRPENNGAMNTLESWIRVADYAVPVIGGQVICLYVQPGDSELTITSRYPYDPSSKDNEACKSKTLKFSLSANSNRTFMICPATKQDHYACGWRVTNFKPKSGCDDQ
jgi:hypothetical protein